MKLKILTGAAMVLFAAGTILAADTALTGYISDSKCGVKGANEGAAECTTKCVKAGAKYVLVTDGDQKIYALDAQDKAAEHAGHHVTVTGTVEGAAIKVSSIEMAAAKQQVKTPRETATGHATGKSADKSADKPAPDKP